MTPDEGATLLADVYLVLGPIYRRVLREVEQDRANSGVTAGERAVLDMLRRRGPMTVAETVPVALGVLAALSALHARGIVHRDLKPSNVFLTPHGVKLLDFGLARPSDPEGALALSSVTQLTRTGMVVGTPRYMAPEQVTGETVDGRGDLFAAGAILFEMLAGRPAFAGKNAVEILHATLNEQPPALTGSPAVAAVDRVIRRALSKRPEERPTAGEVAMLSHLLAEQLGAPPATELAPPPEGATYTFVRV